MYVFDGTPPDMKKQELAKRSSERADAVDGLAEAIETGDKEDIEEFSKRTVKMQTQTCQQMTDETDKEYRRLSDLINENVEAMKTSYTESITKVEASTNHGVQEECSVP